MSGNNADAMESLLRSIIGNAVYTRVQIKCETLEKVADALAHATAALRQISDMGPMSVDDQRWRIAREAVDGSELSERKLTPGPDKCADCGFPRREHQYNGACYGGCGVFRPMSF